MKNLRQITIILLLAVVFTSLPLSASAITVAQVRAAVEARLAAIWPDIQDAMQACTLNQEDCYTTWSIGGTGATADLCNTVTADASTCTMPQTDPGVSDTCGIATGTHKFADYSISLTNPDILAYKLNSYAGPGGRGSQICARLKFNGNAYERCYAIGPQAASFTDATWRVVQ
jgi:hypothetical protein